MVDIAYIVAVAVVAIVAMLLTHQKRKKPSALPSVGLLSNTRGRDRLKSCPYAFIIPYSPTFVNPPAAQQNESPGTCRGSLRICSLPLAREAGMRVGA